MIEQALEYAERGWAVFPCEPRGKRPCGHLVPHGVKQASADPEVVRGWWEAEPLANIGVATGSASGLVVIDLDGERAEQAYGRLLHAHGGPGDRAQPDGSIVRTGGGWHLWLALPDGVSVRNSASKIGAGVDVRGDGGYVIAPPSVHPSGRRYVWRDPVPDGGLPLLRGSWVRVLMPPAPVREARAPRPRPATDGGEATPYALAALRGECEAVRSTPEGGRNARLNDAAFKLGTLVGAGELDLETVIDALADAAADAGLGEKEAGLTIESGMVAGRKHPRARAA